MKVYIAGAWKRRGHIAIVADRLEEVGFTITRKWWVHDSSKHEELQQFAEGDYSGVLQCDAFVVVNYPKSEGKAVETGIALTRARVDDNGPGLFILDDHENSGGSPSNIFQNLDDFVWTFNVEELIDELNDFAERTGR